MDFGAHLPLMDFGGHPFTLDHLVTYARDAESLGFAAISVNDHLVFAVPWLDGPTALAAVLGDSGDLDLMTTVALPVVRGPVPTAKALGAIDLLSGGRLIVGVGPGSSDADYAAVGLDSEERWPRFDESIEALRALWRPEGGPARGRFYATEGITLAPLPARAEGIPIWVGSWGSKAGLRRVARLGDGWLASAYNTTPELFAEARDDLGDRLVQVGRDPGTFPNALATMWCYITDRAADAEKMLTERVAPTIHRPEEVLRQRLPIGSPDSFAERLVAFARAGVQRVFLWPVADEHRQLELFCERVLPLVESELR